MSSGLAAMVFDPAGQVRGAEDLAFEEDRPFNSRSHLLSSSFAAFSFAAASFLGFFGAFFLRVGGLVTPGATGGFSTAASGVAGVGGVAVVLASANSFRRISAFAATRASMIESKRSIISFPGPVFRSNGIVEGGGGGGGGAAGAGAVVGSVIVAARSDRVGPKLPKTRVALDSVANVGLVRSAEIGLPSRIICRTSIPVASWMKVAICRSAEGRPVVIISLIPIALGSGFCSGSVSILISLQQSFSIASPRSVTGNSQ
jgi:hypothetical protein